ncbi:MAG: PAAR domain-containing protein [Quinella sp. 1Q5]|nr:PAAR domain-containing protein [Quinella sp. 1Q5]
MSNVTRLGDIGAPHDACAAVPLITSSENVFVNGLGCGRVSDSYAGHGCFIHPTHTPIISSGSSSVFVNGLPIARIGDSTGCGGVVIEGSPNVWAGD